MNREGLFHLVFIYCFNRIVFIRCPSSRISRISLSGNISYYTREARDEGSNKGGSLESSRLPTFNYTLYSRLVSLIIDYLPLYKNNDITLSIIDSRPNISLIWKWIIDKVQLTAYGLTP